MPTEFRIAVIDAKDAEAKQEILDAFAAMYANPTDEQTGLPQYTPEQLVRRHVKNYVRGVVSQARQRTKQLEIAAAGEVANDIVD